MSANRSVQAAQRRRAAPQDGVMPGRGPQPSINSAQMFANQAKPGQGPNIPNGRLAGQQAAMQQKQMQQQPQKAEGIAGVSKMTIAQAITLITLRLGAVESKLMVLEHEPPSQGISYDGQNNMVLIEKHVIENIINRLESLEKRSSASASASASASGPEIILLKQQFEMLKQSLVQTKSSSIKDNKEIKSHVEILKKEIDDTKELVTVLQNLTMNNSQKILDLSSNFENMDETLLDTEQLVDGEIEYSTLLKISELQNDANDTNDIIETNLKEMIENEMNGQNI